MASPTQRPGGRRYTLRTAIRFWRLAFPGPEDFKLPEISKFDPNPEAVSWIAAAVAEDVAMEEARFSSFQARGSQLAGFAAVLLGLLGALVPAGFSSLTPAWCVAAKVLFVSALALILTSTLLCLVSVVRPMRLLNPERSGEVRTYMTERLVRANSWQLDARRLRGAYMRLVSHEWANRHKAAALFLASACLASGLVSAASCLAILLLDG